MTDDDIKQIKSLATDVGGYTAEFLLTGDERFLERSDKAKDKLEQKLKEIQKHFNMISNWRFLPLSAKGIIRNDVV